MPLTKVQSTGITDSAVTTAKINADAVTDAKIADNAVVTAAINADAVTSAKIADNAVVTAAINADAVTGAKIADDAINSEHFTDGSIDTAHIGDNQVTSAKATGIGGLVATGQVDSGGNVGAVVLNDIFTSTYKNYIVIVDKLVPASGGAAVYMQFRDESGGLGGSDYGYSNRALQANNGGEDNSDGDGQTQVKFAGGGIGNISNKLGMRMVMHVQEPYDSSVYTGFHGTYGFINNSGYAVHGYLGGLHHQNDSIRGLHLYLNTGGNLNARIKAYGVVDS